MLKHKITNHGIKKEKSTDIETKTWLEKNHETRFLRKVLNLQAWCYLAIKEAC